MWQSQVYKTHRLWLRPTAIFLSIFFTLSNVGNIPCFPLTAEEIGIIPEVYRISKLRLISWLANDGKIEQLIWDIQAGNRGEFGWFRSVVTSTKQDLGTRDASVDWNDFPNLVTSYQEGAGAKSLGIQSLGSSIVDDPVVAVSDLTILNNLLRPANVLVPYPDIEHLSPAQKQEEIEKLAGANPKQKIRVLVVGAPSWDKPPELDFPHIHFITEENYANAIKQRGIRDAQNIFLSVHTDLPKEAEALFEEDARFRYPTKEHGLLGVALLSFQIIDKAKRRAFFLAHNITQVDGYYSTVSAELLAKVQEHLTILVLGRAA